MRILGAFVGRSFNKDDEPLWVEIQKHLNSLKSLGFVWEDAEEGQAKPISDKVKERIDRNNIFIGLLTKREPICRNILQIGNYNLSEIITWLTSYWVIQESGYAIGKGKKVLFLIERGLTVPPGLNADFEYIEIDRSKPSLSFTKINEIVNTEIAERIIPTEEQHVIKATELILTEQPHGKREEKKEPEGEKSTLNNNFFEMMELIKQKDYPNAEKLFKLLMEQTVEDGLKNFYQAIYLETLYESGKTEALSELKQFTEKNPTYYFGIELLIDGFSFYDEYDKAEKVLIDLIAKANEEEFKQKLSVLLSQILIKQKKFDEAINVITPFSKKTSVFSNQDNFNLYKSLADIYMAKKQVDISCALYDMALSFLPSEHSVRFDAAYKYAEINKHLMSLYHYKTYLNLN